MSSSPYVESSLAYVCSSTAQMRSYSTKGVPSESAACLNLQGVRALGSAFTLMPQLSPSLCPLHHMQRCASCMSASAHAQKSLFRHRPRTLSEPGARDALSVLKVSVLIVIVSTQRGRVRSSDRQHVSMMHVGGAGHVLPHCCASQ